MRRARVPIATLAFASALILGCTSSPPLSTGGATDAASGPQPIGAPCAPSLATPCLPTGDPCLGVQCLKGVTGAYACAEHEVADAGATCSGGEIPCATIVDCAAGLTCGFPIGAGCSATGRCINLPLACEEDAAVCGGVGSVCGCDGLPVPIVVFGYAGAPTPTSTSPDPTNPTTPAECGPDDAGLSREDGGAPSDASSGGAADD